MDYVKVRDPEGNELRLSEYDGMYFSPSEGFKQRMDQLPTLRARDDDMLILAYSKSGTHWVWEIAQLLSKNRTENVVGEKDEEFLEMIDLEKLDKVPSPRMLNSHIRPRFLPPDLVNRKCKIIYIQRNPKDVMVSLYNHCKNLGFFYDFDGSFSGFFHLAMSGQVECGNWFEYTLEYEEFFKNHPDIPVLRLHYEDMKQDLLSNVRRLSEFCGYVVSEETMRGIAEACTFSSMKKFKTKEVDPERAKRWRGGSYNMYRKGVSGDWKNYFTVAQNEQFEAEAARRLAGMHLDIRWVN